MGKAKVQKTVLLREWIRNQPNKEVFTVDNTSIYCQACSKSYTFKKKSQLDQHASSVLHKTSTVKYLSKGEKQVLIPELSGRQSNFYYELGEAFLAADIPWRKLQVPKFKTFMEKYMTKSLPDESTLRKNYVPLIFEQCLEDIRIEIGDAPIWLQIDESTDANGRFMANVLVGGLRCNAQSDSHLILVKQLQSTNNATITQTVIEALELLWPENTQEKINRNFLLLLTDGVAYMLKAGKNLQRTYPKVLHVTCMAHALHLLAEKVRSLYKKPDKVIASVKATFVKAPSRVAIFKETCPDLPLPPEPVLTRWGTWLAAAKYYAENLPKIREVLQKLNENDACCIATAKSHCEDANILEQFRFIDENFGFLVGSIKKLETSGLSLLESVAEIDNVVAKLSSVTGNTSEDVSAKMTFLLNKNKGFSKIKKICKILEGSAEYSDDIGIPNPLVRHFLYAPITTVDTERSFSMEKRVIDARRNLTAVNVDKYLVCQYKLSKCKD